MTSASRDLNLPPINANLTPDVQRMPQAGSDFVPRCMTVDRQHRPRPGGPAVRLTRHPAVARRQPMPQSAEVLEPPSGRVLHHRRTCPPRRPPRSTPSTEYLSAMKKSRAAYVGTDTADRGWGVGRPARRRHRVRRGVDGRRDRRRPASSSPRRSWWRPANHLTNFTAEGLLQPVDWETAAHHEATPPFCTVFEQASGTAFRAGVRGARASSSASQPPTCATRRRGAAAGPAGRLGGLRGAAGGTAARVRRPRHPVRLRVRRLRRRPRPHLPGDRRLQLRLRRAGVRVGLRLRLADPGPAAAGLVGVSRRGRRRSVRASGCSSTASSSADPDDEHDGQGGDRDQPPRRHPGVLLLGRLR